MSSPTQSAEEIPPPPAAPSPSIRRSLVLSGIGGVLVAASLPPWPMATGAWPLAIVGLAMIFVALDSLGARTRLVCGLVAATGLYLPALWWVRDFSVPGYGLVAVVEALMLGAALVFVPRTGPGRVLALPAALVLAEAVRGAWPFGGLPLAGIDLGQVSGPFAPVAGLGGRLGLVAVVGLAGAGLGELARWAIATASIRPERKPASVRRLGAGVGALALAVISGVGATAAPDGMGAGSIRVAVVQGDGVRGMRAVKSDPSVVFEAHLAASRRIRGPVDLIVWPEDVVDVDGLLAGSAEEATVGEVASETNATVIAGIVEDIGTDRFRNAATAYGPDGRFVDRYDKVHLVPFGERIPWRGLVESLTDVSAVPRDAIPGTGPGILRTAAGRLGVLISYEVFFADRARAAAQAGARVLLVPTNASSFVDAQVPAQELAAARLRAIETGRWVVQAAPTGYSAVIDHRGRVLARSSLGDAAVLQAAVGLRTGRTVAVVVGPAPVVLAAIMVLALCARPRRLVGWRRAQVPVTGT